MSAKALAVHQNINFRADYAGGTVWRYKLGYLELNTTGAAANAVQVR